MKVFIDVVVYLVNKLQFTCSLYLNVTHEKGE